ncbi:hypothetical protein FBY09_11348 [Pseudomonas sp. SJZ101]|nr:hypothetical protein FBY00_11348 [Pseudomonas sp. SJZ075]TWC31871.1 hypothetical protein FBY02_11371 [Pseudomonas sp. SJZ078]TWC50273.1 hypothetical protein FBY11_12126 [Pseudomonas sp. SJZ124]TWC87675.1 hypothetical protein FBY09_11348 [Pseudomonas sp. SJZ101]
MPGFTPRLAIPQGEHLDLLKTRIPGWYSGAIVQRQQELSDHPLELRTGMPKPPPSFGAASRTAIRATASV